MKKKATEELKQTKGGKIANIIVNILLVFVLIFAFLCTYTAFTTKKGNGVPNLFGNIFLSIQSDSMAPTFEKGDMIIDKEVKDASNLENGDVITFWTIINGQRVLNTHRIIGVEKSDSFTYYYTKGDNNSIADTMTVHESEIVGTYSSRIKGAGAVMDFLQTSKGFLIAVVIPVLAFFIYYLVVFFRSLMAYKNAKHRLEMEQEIQERVAAATAGQNAENTSPDPSVPQASQEEGVTLSKEQLLALLKQAGVTEPDGSAATKDTTAEA